MSGGSSNKKGNYNIEDCLKAFTKEEVLGKGDEWYCSKCKDHVQATKKMEIYRAPQILILHLKRFRTNRIHNFGKYYFSGGSQKISTNIKFPLQEFNLNSYVLAKNTENDEVNYIYDLFAVSNHYGSLSGGHYTAYAFSQFQKQWMDFNDSTVRTVSSSEVVSEAAYLLFYRRRDAQPIKLLHQK